MIGTPILVLNETVPGFLTTSIHLPPSGWKRDGDMGQAFTGPCQQIGDVLPGFEAAAATGLEHAQSGGVGRRALLGAGAVGDPPGNDGVTQGTFAFVVGGGQIGMGDEGGDGGPIVEDLAGECPNLLGLIVAVKLAGPLQPGKYRIDDAGAGALGAL